MLFPLVSLCLAAAPLKVAMMPLSAGDGVPDKTAATLGDYVAGEVRRVPGVRVMTRDELGAVLSLERQKELVTCKTDSCLSEIAGALDVDRLVTGGVAKLGQSWILQLQLLDPRKARTIAHADRRQKGAQIDDVLDVIPAMVHELFGAAPVESAPEKTAAAPVPSASATLPPPWHDEPLALGDTLSRLSLATDGKGHYAAYVMGDIDVPFLWGDAKALYQQRVRGGGAEGTVRMEEYFWEPRVRGGASQAMFEVRDGNIHVVCGKTEIPLKAVPPAEAKSLFAKTKTLGPRWARMGHALARDDDGNYYYVDQDREPEGNNNFHLYVGPKGKVQPLETEVLASDEELILGSKEGKLKVSPRKNEAEWIVGDARRKLTLLELESNVQLIYTALGAYKGQRLGTPCDGVLAPQ